MTKKSSPDKIFLGIVLALVVIGLIAFTSASLGILARNEKIFYDVIFKQYLFGFLGGVIALYIGYKIPF